MIKPILRVLLTLLLAHSAYARTVAIIVDTSRSMNDADRQRYAVQIAKILGDLVEDNDNLVLIRMPTERQLGPLLLFGVEPCAPSAAPNLAVQLRGSDRNSFKNHIDGIMTNDTGTFFAMPIATAEDYFRRAGAAPKMLLLLADSGGFATNCASDLNSRLARLRQGGVFVGLVNLGSSAGSFAGSRAFDLALGAPSSQALVEAVARIYQQFLGAKKVQTGAVRGAIRVKVDPYVSEAYLVVAAEGPLAPLQPGGGNPGAQAIDPNYRGGGATVGLDRRNRGYRIVKLTNPNAGDWEFGGTNVTGGWMLIQEYAIAVRVIPGQQVAAGSNARINLEVYDQRNGQRIADPAVAASLGVSLTLDGRSVEAANNGDGTLSVDYRFPNAGKHTIQARVSSDVLDRVVPVTVEAVSSGWEMESLTGAAANVGQPSPIRVRLKPVGSGRAAEPDRIRARAASGETVELHKMPDGTFSGDWTPSQEGDQKISLEPVGGQNVASLETVVRVGPRIESPSAAPETPVPPPAPSPPTGVESSPVSPPPPPDEPPPPPPPPPVTLSGISTQAIEFGQLKSGSQAAGRLSLEGATREGGAELLVSTDLPTRGLALEIEGPDGWTQLGPSSKAFPWTNTSWPVRLRVERCPAACSPTDQYHIDMAVQNAGGMSQTVRFPLRVEVLPDPWLTCFWPYLAGLGMALVVGFGGYGFYSPFRFARRVGVQLSPEPDLAEGFFYALRRQPGSKSGFYRHARLFVSDDFRVSGKRNGAFVQLRAGRNNKIYIAPYGGREVWRQRMDGEWERLPGNETVAPTGTAFRNGENSVFFDLRIR